jgi:hypothetical protein
LIGLLAVFYLATPRPGHPWGDDHCLYLIHARNLAEGRRYDDTGFRYHRGSAAYSPRTYPPVFPLLLAPMYAGFGLDLVALKLVGLAALLLFVTVIYATLVRELPWSWAVVVALLLGFNPLIAGYKDEVLSEAPFLLFVYLALFLADRARDATRSPAGRAQIAVLAGLVAYLAIGTRSAGLVLVPAFVAPDLLRRRLSRPTVLAVLACGACLVLQALLLPRDSSYLDQLIFDPRLYVANLVSQMKLLMWYLDNGHANALLLRPLLYAMLTCLAVMGFVVRVRQAGFGVREAFGVFYWMLLWVWPSAEGDPRFLVPLWPLFLIYAAHSLYCWQAAGWPQLAGAVAAGLALALVASHVSYYAGRGFSRFSEGTEEPEATAMLDFFRTATPADAVVVCQRPRAIALYAGRPAAVWPRIDTRDDEVWRFLREYRAEYLLISPQFDYTYEPMSKFVADQPQRFRKVFDNGQFVVYRILPEGG